MQAHDTHDAIGYSHYLLMSKKNIPMLERPAWFNACIIAAVFATILIPASASMGFFAIVLNLIGVAMFVVPMVAAVRDGDLA